MNEIGKTHQTGDAAPQTTGESPARPTGGALHPRVYAIVIALVAWFVLAVWLFAGGGVTDYLLFIVSGFIFTAVALPLILAAVRRDDGDATAPSYRDWAAADFRIWDGRLSGRQAAVQVLLPIAAAAVGMTIFGIALHVAERGGV